MLKRTLIATAAAATLLGSAAAPASAQEDVCVGPIDFTGRHLCVLETVGQTAPTPPEGLDVCVIYDFTGRDFCVIRDTIGGGG